MLPAAAPLALVAGGLIAPPTVPHPGEPTPAAAPLPAAPRRRAGRRPALSRHIDPEEANPSAPPAPRFVADSSPAGRYGVTSSVDLHDGEPLRIAIGTEGYGIQRIRLWQREVDSERFRPAELAATSGGR
ncbi:hypothetical protein [Plantactinospora veratri]